MRWAHLDSCSSPRSGPGTRQASVSSRAPGCAAADSAGPGLPPTTPTPRQCASERRRGRAGRGQARVRAQTLPRPARTQLCPSHAFQRPREMKGAQGDFSERGVMDALEVCGWVIIPAAYPGCPSLRRSQKTSVLRWRRPCPRIRRRTFTFPLGRGRGWGVTASTRNTRGRVQGPRVLLGNSC